MLETKRQNQKKITRKHLIEIAINQFGENGIIKTRTSDIAEVANVSHGTVFAHFPTQEQLLISVIEEFGNRITVRLHELVNTNSSLLQVLEAHIEGLIEFEPFYTRFIIERRLLPESARDAYVIIQSTISFHISIAAEKEIEQGKIRKTPIHLIYNTWIGLIHYYITNSDLFSLDGSVLQKYGHELVQHYINLIADKQYKEENENKMKQCIACGMPMKTLEDFAMGDLEKEYCLYCCRPDGTMQSYDEKLNSLTNFIVKTQGLDTKTANSAAKSMMAKLLAWKTD